jgi:hypothetical protein
MAAALAQTQVPHLSSPLRLQGEVDAGACEAPRPRCWPPGDATAACVHPEEGIPAAAAAACSDPDGIDSRVEPVVLGPDGKTYPGVLLDDILEYRSLRANMLAGNHIDEDAHARYVELEERLRTYDATGGERGHLRAFHRFDVQLSAGVRFRIGRQRAFVSATVQNISAGGVKLTMPETPTIGDAVWLQLRLPGGALAVLPSRVIWARETSVGLMFAGAPRWT